MPTVLDRSALEQSPLADLHLLANELGVDGFRRLRKPDLVDAILARQGGEAAAEEPVAVGGGDEDEAPKRSRRGRRGGRGRRRDEDEGDSGRDRDRDRDEEPVAETRGGGGEDKIATGTVELLANGSGFLRLSEDEESEGDIYISAAQVKRCELVSGDKISGPVRPARRSERFASLVRVDTINGRPADEVAEGTRFEELPVAWPEERIALGAEDAAVNAVQWLTPFGKGSRVVIAGAARSGKSELLRRLAVALAAKQDLEVSAVLAGVLPEEIADWPVTPSAALTFAASSDAQAQAVEQAVETGRRVAARGGDAVVLIDGFEYLPANAARRALAAGRNLSGGGSLTVIATSLAPVGGETTVIALDAAAAALGTFPALALAESGVLRADLLVGEAGVEAIRAAVAGGEFVPPVVEEVAPEPEPEAKPKPKGKAKPKAKAKAKPKPAAETASEPVAAAAAEVEAVAAEPAAAKPKAKAKATAKKKPAAKKAAAAKKKPAARSRAKKPAAGSDS
ncbi:Rho termination factor N-terminal domain-containing protein [Solirubrobacter deserti]|uniref:Rho termination factor N-terminal domain-containing protein n=1 Tax=Solirubrobacter deserti TaxID=2282478 RepID=A0ABT4RDT8_9ACTN|nr:Rho termination factor N-terminal domain-containing protein [Solirubrobacter deserti]MDA0136678.1 Rho termination factor N-terminal domain-containing protein [Solirubrobacter deserti]